MNRLIAAAAVIAAIAAGGLWYSQNRTTTASTPATAELVQGITDTAAESEVDTSKVIDMALGNADAPVTVVEYASFTCPHCRHFHDDVFGKIKANYIDTGKVRFILREVYFDRFGLWAAMLARCGGEMRYFGVVDLIFGKQQEWTKGNSAPEIVGNLKKLGRAAGMDDATMDQCLQDAPMAEALVAVYQQHMAEDDVPGTPTFFINGQQFSNMSYPDFAKALDAALAEN